MIENETKESNSTEKIETSLYSPEDIPSIASAVAVYINAFSKEPFNEKWHTENGNQFNTQDMDQLSDFLKQVLFNPNELEINSAGNKQIMEFNNMLIETKYPLSNIINTYASCLNNKESVLIVRNDNKLYELSNGERIPEGSENKSDALVRLINYSPNEKSISTHILDEVGHYLNEQEKKDLLSSIQNVKTGYFGEIVNLKDQDSGLGSFIMFSFRKYLSKFKDSLPDQYIYMTKHGTSIENEKNSSQFMDKMFSKVFNPENVRKTKKIYSNNTIIYIYNIQHD
ncbi:MAG: hypothetical protein KBH94_03280 [Caldisericia bacterium]|nr:hypothetical protein [Caldisericia bacterium]